MSLADHQLKRITTPNAAKILTIDIERLAGTAYAFDPKTRYIGASNWITPPRTVCWAARWYGQKRVMFEAEWIDRDRMVQRSWELYDQADIVVTFNGIRFDNKHLRSLWFEAGMPPPRPWKDVDLFAISARQMGFEFKSLDFLTRRLGRPGKQLHYNVWQTQAAVDGDKTAQAELRTYNAGDIELTEWLYDRFRGWIPSHPFIGTIGDEKMCNQCGSQDLTLQPSRHRAVVLDYALYRCDNCGGNVRGGWVARAANTRGVR
jgi:hypothetical protein